MENLKRNSCRICLSTKISNYDANVKDVGPLYKKLTGYSVGDEDFPRKVCKVCLSDLFIVQEFFKKCKETEEILSKYRDDIVKDEDPESESTLLLMEIKQENSEQNEHLNLLDDEERCSVTPKIVSEPFLEKQKSALICCDRCGKSVKAYILKKHLKTHNPPQKFTCDICQYSCQTKNRIAFHIKQRHLKIIKFKCEYCGFEIDNRQSFNYHIITKHTKNFKHICIICGKGCVSKHHLDLHVFNHSDVRRFSCDLCNSSFKNHYFLNRHRKDTHSDKTFPCDTCGKVFKSTKFLKQHQKFHLPHEFFCPRCVQTFSMGQTLRNHIKNVHPELPLPPSGTQLRNVRGFMEYLERCGVE